MSEQEQERERIEGDFGLIIDGIDRWTEAGKVGAIDDRTARIIASHWHDGQTSAFYSFVSTGRIDKEGMAIELLRCTIEVDPNDYPNNDALEALGLYIIEHGERDAQDGWPDRTRW